MFVQAFEQISKKIGASKQKEQGYKILEKKIIENAILKSQFAIYLELKENVDKFVSNSDYNSFLISLKEKAAKYSKSDVDKEVKSLLEYFNINPSSVKTTVMDSAMRLDENAISKIVLNKRKQMIAESYKSIIRNEDEEGLRKQFQIINFLSESISDKKRKSFAKQSLRALLEEKYKDYNSCVKKLYKLRSIVEGIIKEDFDDEEGQVKSEYGGGKKAPLKSLKLSYIEDVEVQVPEMWKKPEKIVVSFYIPIYPVGATQSASTTSAIKAKQTLQRMERPFINYTVYQKNRTQVFDPVGTIWDIGLRMQAKPGKVIYAGVDVYLNTNSQNDGKITWEQCVATVADMLKEFDVLLPKLMGNNVDVLTPDAMRNSLKSAKGMTAKQKMDAANKSGEVDRSLIKKKIGSDDGEGQEIPDENDFAFDNSLDRYFN